MKIIAISQVSHRDDQNENMAEGFGKAEQVKAREMMRQKTGGISISISLSIIYQIPYGNCQQEK